MLVGHEAEEENQSVYRGPPKIPGREALKKEEDEAVRS